MDAREGDSKTQFFAHVIQELRTPLTEILDPAQRLVDDTGALTVAQRRESAEIISRNARILLGQVDDLLDMARLESGRLEYDIQPVDVREVVTEVLLMVEPQLAARGLDSVADVPGDRRVAADPERLRQILLNLLSNAIRFTDRGGYVMIDVGLPQDISEDIVLLRVADSGAGISRARQDEVFEPFVQLHPSTETPGGLGLGLTISRGLARGMGGDLRVRGDEGKGSVFTLSLPRA